MRRSKKCVLMAAVLAAGCVYGWLGAAGAAGAGQKNVRRPATQGKSLFKQNCVKCHGLDGAGRTVMGEVTGAPNFTDASWQGGVSEQRMVTSIMHGRAGMPSFKDKFSSAEVSALVAHIRRFKN